MVCKKCGTYNDVENGLSSGFESYICTECMSIAFIGQDGLYAYMARTKMNEIKAYEDLLNELTFTTFENFETLEN